MMLLQAHEVTSSDIYLTLFLAGVAWLAQFFIQWGVARQQFRDFGRRIDALEGTLADRILPRQEYENRHKDLQARLQRLEDADFLRSNRRFNREAPET